MNLKIVEVAERWAETMWEASATASVLALVAGLTVWALRKKLGPSWRFALWGVVLVRLLLPMTPESSMSLLNLGRMFERETAVRPIIAPFAIAPMVDHSFAPVEFDAGELGAGTTVNERQRQVDWGAMLALGWLAGVVLFGMRLILGAGWLRWRVTRESGGAGPNLEGIWAAAAREGMRIRGRVVLTDVVNSPALFGIWRPRLLMPRNLAETLDEAQLRHVFLHELAHLKRRDLLTNGCMAAAQVLHWWNPVVWFVVGRMRLERELACDEMVLRLTDGGERGEAAGRAYGETILRLIEGVNGGKRIPALVGIAEEKKAVRTRLEQIAAFRGGAKVTWTRPLLGGLTVLMLAAAGLTSAQEKRTADQKSMSAAESASAVTQWLDAVNALIQQKRWEEAEALISKGVTIAPEYMEAVSATLREQQLADEFRQREQVTERMSTDPIGVRTLLRKEQARTGGGRQAILKRMQEIIIDHYEVPNALPLTEIIKDIHAQARKLDPENKGVNFVISSQLENPGLTEPDAEAKPLKVGDYRVKISPALRKVTLAGLINAIVEVAVPPTGHEGAPGLRYWVEEYAVMFGQRVKEAEQLYTRTYKLDPNTFIHGLDGVYLQPNPFTQGSGANQSGGEYFRLGSNDPGQPATGASGEGGGGVSLVTTQTSTTAIQEAIRAFFRQAGVDVQTVAPQSPAPTFGAQQKAIFFNDRTGVLFVRASLADQQKIEKALQRLNAANPPQMMFTVEALEVKSAEELEQLIRLMALREFRTALTSPEYRAMRLKIEQAGMQWIKMPTVTTLSKRPARIDVEGRVGVDVTADYNAQEKTLTLRASSFGSRREESSPTQEGEIYDGQTFAVMPESKGGSVVPQRVVFITVDVIDAAGNKVNNSDEFIETVSSSVP